MSSIKLDENGDIIFNSLGKIELLYDRDALVQSFLLKLKTKKGELFYNEDYGYPILKGKQDENSILDYLKDTLLDDERINDIEIVSFIKTDFGKYKVDIEIQLENGEILDFNFLT